MKRIVKKPGDLFRFPTDKGRHGYCQWLPHDARVFAISTSESVAANDVVELPVAFRVPIFHDTPGRYGWERIGNMTFPPECEKPQAYVKQDSITKRITVYRGEAESKDERPASPEDIATLETLAVWAHPHIVERLLAHLAGTSSRFLESVRVRNQK